MRPFYCRAGSKRKYSKALVSLFPEHAKYVEPFLGGGAVFWEKEPSPAEVVNDLDKQLVADYRLLASAPTNPKLYPILPSKTSQDEFLSKSYRGTAPKLVEALLRRCNGYGGSYIPKGGKVSKTTTHEDKINRIGDYKARLRHATLTSESYESLLRKHDGAKTFFFLDPPYEKSVGLDYVEGSDKFDFRKFADELGKVKGKFLVTINDSPNIRTLFKAFKLYPYVVKGHHAKSAIGRNDRPELLITNYDLPSDWKSRMTKGVLKGGAYYCPDDCEDEMEGSGTHRENVLKKLGLPENGYSLAELAKASDVPKATLQKVYNRGIGAYKTNPESVRMKVTFEKGVKAPMSQKLSKEQWAQSRVYSFLDGNPKHDQDLRGGARGDVNVASTWNHATFKTLEFLPTGGGCGMFAFAVLRDYLRAPINLEDVRNRILGHGEGSLSNTDIDEVLQDAGMDFLHGHGNMGAPMDGAAIETVFETIREMGACALVITTSPVEQHVTAVLPRRTPATAGGGGYEIWAFDCRREEPYNMTDRAFPLARDDEYIVEMYAIPMNPAPMPEPEAKEGSGLRGGVQTEGARGSMNPAIIWGSAVQAVTLPTGFLLPDSCSVFAYSALMMYLNLGANVRALRRHVMAHGAPDIADIANELIATGAELRTIPHQAEFQAYLAGADRPPPLRTLIPHINEALWNSVAEGGYSILVYGFIPAGGVELGHVSTLLPRRKVYAGEDPDPAQPYQVWWFDCNVGAPVRLMSPADMTHPFWESYWGAHAVVSAPERLPEWELADDELPVRPPSPEAKEGSGKGGVKYKTYLEEALGELPDLYKRRAEVENAIRLNPYYPPMMRVDPALLDLQLTGINQLITGYESALKAIAENPARAVADWEDRRKGHRRPFFGKGLSGGARGDFNASDIFKRAEKVAGDLIDAGGGCAVFGLIVLQEYLNVPINIRRACRLAKNHPEMGRVFRRDTYALLKEGIPGLTDADIHDNNLNLLPNAVVETAMNRVENEGVALLVGTPGHIRVILPLRNEPGVVAAGGPRYRAVLFGSESVSPHEVTGATLGGVNGLVVIDQEPLPRIGGAKSKNLEHQLSQMAYAPMTYIRDVRKKAKKAGYDPQMVGFANDGEHKLEIHTPTGQIVRFGRVGYGDHLIWTHLEKRGEAPKGVAEVKRRVFRKSHSAIRGDWRADKFSPNNLALSILW